jgi:ribonucrease Y
MQMNEYILLVVIAAVISYALLLAVFKLLLPKKLRRENLDRKATIIREAKTRAEMILSEAKRRADALSESSLEEIEEQIQTRKSDLISTEEELATQEEFAEHAEQRLAKDFQELELQERKVQSLVDKAKHFNQELTHARVELVQQLEEYSQSNALNLKEQIGKDFVEKRKLEFQRVLKNLEEDVSTNARKLASRMLYRLESRYAPQFTWPKAVNHVDILDPKLVDALQNETIPLLALLKELSEDVNVELVVSNEQPSVPFVKFAGGFGVYKEAARSTLEEALKQGNLNSDRIKSIYRKQLAQLQHQALLLGRQAIKELKLNNVHEEIQKMVGYLNWRTSYRQNQYLHTVEVARLAGFLAHEIGVDPDVAKRCGLMHDIGKTLDYKIEGSHAVISGDYADRYGESRLVCDTCMSHHNDLVLETPMSYVLKTADTLSGARPGARVNLEEGYQIRLSAIDEVVRSFKGIAKVAIMNGGREVHVEVNHKKISEFELENLTQSIARKIEVDVAFPGQIKVLVSRRFESTAVA